MRHRYVSLSHSSKVSELGLETQYTISELSDAAAVTARTIRYYVSEGLIAPPVKGGRGASYSEEHLARLRLIRRLKDEYLPLQEIAALMRGLDRKAVDELLEKKEQQAKPATKSRSSAKAYVRELLDASERASAAARKLRAEAAARTASPAGSAAWRRLVIEDGIELHVRADRALELDDERDKLDRVLRFAKSVLES